ncbi:hypothetical protein HANVADRAFT_53499 [Hanseniaspora valbyensis NRRL Y-1626]|uniref:Amino acid transporter n=1 Tax=Hanseniaspora valbyensis NRRL Y-1626 TaxID=766949 RepID=A0A1B7TBB0_9ASCO|nr:hypothetical protein HANVADRAFT_53499 [Hanseniaspora valbyensis NRRL Y-1626]
MSSYSNTNLSQSFGSINSHIVDDDIVHLDENIHEQDFLDKLENSKPLSKMISITKHIPDVDVDGHPDNDVDSGDSDHLEQQSLFASQSAKSASMGRTASRVLSHLIVGESNQSHLDDDDYHEVPQGRHLGLFSTTIIFVSRIIGSGIFSSSAIFINCGGNPMLYFIVWTVATFFAIFGLYLYLEFGCLIPKNGGTKNFLERSFDKPKNMTSVIFGIFSVLTGFITTSAIVFARYMLSLMGYPLADNRIVNLLGGLTVVVATLIHGLHMKKGVQIQNLLGIFKLFTIAIMIITSLIVLFVPGILSKNLNDDIEWPPFFEFETNSLYSFSQLPAAFIQALYCFSGWSSIHNNTAEIINPEVTIRKAGIYSLAMTFLLYISLCFAIIKVLSYQEIADSGSLLGYFFFKKIYGEHIGGKFVTLTIALSALSNLFVCLFGIGRMNQEIFRNGILPFSKTLAKNYKNSPLNSLLVGGLMTLLLLLVTSSSGTEGNDEDSSNAYTYIVSVESYYNQVILFFVVIALYIYRKKNKAKGRPDAPIKSFETGNIFLVMLSLYLLLAPFIMKDDSAMNNINGFPPYNYMAVYMIFVCFLYWLIKFELLPRIFKYNLVCFNEFLEDGLKIQTWKKMPRD